MLIPDSIKERLKLAERLKEDCDAGRGMRSTSYKNYGQWLERGWASDDGQGGMALANVLFSHNDRVAAHLFSPSDLRFTMAFDRRYKKDWIERGTVASRAITEDWHNKSTDLLFGHGVKVAVDYGACLMRQMAGRDEEGHYESRGCRLVMPWCFGVANEGVNGLEGQEYFCETTYLNKYEVWRRIRTFPDALKIFEKVVQSADRNQGNAIPTSFMHQVLSTAVLDLSPVSRASPTPGGWIQTTGGPAFPPMTPQVHIDLYAMHEIWAWNDVTSDYTTLVYIEPDILISPRYMSTSKVVPGKTTNLFVPGHHGYTLIQPNYAAEYFFGYSELKDLMRLQSWLTEHLGDIRKLMGQQFDQILAISGDMIQDEQYATMKAQGLLNLGMGGSVNNITPRIPDQALPLIGEILFLMDRISGFQGVVGGQGETGVRAGTHAETLMKMGSTRLRDRSLLVERQAAMAGDETLAMFQAKDDSTWWINEEDESTYFQLADLPPDRRIVVDSHSSSPIYQDDHIQLVAWGVKAGLLDPITAIEMLPFQNKDLIIERVQQMMKQKQAELAKVEKLDPEAFVKAVTGQSGGHHRRAA
ncbi:MAG TPA: hypothetical protein VGR84_19020 [Candidatus Acidoferrales bacterium]|nr:hypothetical protein [Candidatus Acidoferrales bacterium]